MKLIYGIIIAFMVFVSACSQQTAQPVDNQPGDAMEDKGDAMEDKGDALDDNVGADPTDVVVAEPKVDSYDIRYGGAGGFDPSELTIAAGSSITFFNDDSKTIVIIVFKDGRNFATPRVNSGQQTEVEFTEPGKYDFWWNVAYNAVGGTITVVDAMMESDAEEAIESDS